MKKIFNIKVENDIELCATQFLFRSFLQNMGLIISQLKVMHFKSDDSRSGRSSKNFLPKISKLPENHTLLGTFKEEGAVMRGLFTM